MKRELIKFNNSILLIIAIFNSFFFSFLNLQRWNIEETKLKRTEVSGTEKIDASMDIPKLEVEETEKEGKQSEKLVSMEKRVEVCSKECAD